MSRDGVKTLLAEGQFLQWAVMTIPKKPPDSIITQVIVLSIFFGLFFLDCL